MKFNNIPDFLDALKTKMNQLEPGTDITGSTDICGDFTPEELEKFAEVKDEAFALFPNKTDATEFMYHRLSDLGYTDDEITQIFDCEGI